MNRGIAKVLLIGGIVAGFSGVILGVLPQYFDLESEKVTYTGFPTYACTEPYNVQSCLNKTNLHGYVFTESGLEVLDVNFELKSFSSNP